MTSVSINSSKQMIDAVNIRIDATPHGYVTVDLSMIVERAPSDINDMYLMLANNYLKGKNISMTLDEIIENFLPEHMI